MTPQDRKYIIEARRKLIQKHNTAIFRLVNDALPEEMDTDFFTVIGHWDCPDSPFGVCMYDTFEDSAKDDCLFCHQPEERK